MSHRDLNVLSILSAVFPALMIEPSPELPAYYRWVLGGLETVVSNQKETADSFKIQAMEELINLPPELHWLKEEGK